MEFSACGQKLREAGAEGRGHEGRETEAKTESGPEIRRESEIILAIKAIIAFREIITRREDTRGGGARMFSHRRGDSARAGAGEKTREVRQGWEKRVPRRQSNKTPVN